MIYNIIIRRKEVIAFDTCEIFLNSNFEWHTINHGVDFEIGAFREKFAIHTKKYVDSKVNIKM